MSTNVRELLVAHKCVLEGEFFFVLKSGQVATKYINIDPVLTKPLVLSEIARQMMRGRRYKGPAPDVIAGPAIGAIPLAYLAAMTFQSASHPVPDVVFTEKDGDGFTLDRSGFKEAVAGKEVLVVEDVGTTLGSALKTCEQISEAGGSVCGVELIWDRGDVCKLATPFPANALIKEDVETWEVGEHPAWGQWPIVNDVGHPGKVADYAGDFVPISELLR